MTGRDRRLARLLGLAACLSAVVLLAIALVVAPTALAQGAGPRVIDAWVRLPAAPGRPAAGYFTLTGGAQAERLVAASSPLAERIELHATVTEAGVSRMVALAGVDLPAGGEIRFSPRGNHLMLFGLKSGWETGGVPLILRFASGRTLDVRARALAPSALPQPQMANPKALLPPDDGPTHHQH
jgi:copper(I)-binding protein